jgi:AbrB family looped-hinge helix DNA binding protein
VAKVTSKLQVTIPKAIADEYRIRPGDEIGFEADGAFVRVVPPSAPPRVLSRSERLRLFDAATERQRSREAAQPAPAQPAAGRGWRREDLYTRGDAR